VVIASLSTTTSRGEPLPTLTGLSWLLEQAQDSTSPYFQHLDTARIGALGHSEGGASTSIAAADPRISAIATVSGTRTLTALHGPALFICGELDTVVPCAGIATNFRTVTDQPAMFVNNLGADHGSWLGQNGSQGPTFFALTAWFRVHLMDDADNRRFFFGPDCALCTDDRVTIERNGLIDQ
jgi:dienelactone hydrolase